MLRSASSSSIPFRTTSEIYDQHGEANCRIPHVQWTSYGGLSSFSGTAVTVDCKDLQPADNSVVKQVLTSTASGEGKVLVVDAGGSTKFAFLGDQLATIAQQKGWNGIVVHGCVRDAQELKELPLGIVAIGTTPRKTEKQGGKGGTMEVRVRIGDADCYPGDYVFCDADGVIFMNPPNVFKA
jgi:regulator of ribonuclease activity A